MSERGGWCEGDSQPARAVSNVGPGTAECSALLAFLSFGWRTSVTIVLGRERSEPACPLNQHCAAEVEEGIDAYDGYDFSGVHAILNGD